MEPAVAVSALLPAGLPSPLPLAAVRNPRHVGEIGWQLLHRSGALRPLTDDVAVPAAVPATAELRASALRDRVPPRAVVVGTTALWVWCGGQLDEDLTHAYRSSGFRLGAESRDVAGVRVTTPERTAVDLASRLPRPAALDSAVALGYAGADLGVALLTLESRTRTVGRAAAREVLREAREVVRAADGGGTAPCSGRPARSGGPRRLR